MSKYDALWTCVRGDGRPEFRLSFSEIESVLGFPIDHSFLNAKKELLQYGYQVGKISLKGKTVLFQRLD